MALNDISLTSGMRANLLNLQNTVDLLNRTQQRLSTGKKVNTPIDNPLNYFVAKSLTDRASDISTAKDSMSEGIQTISAANNGITAINALVAAAKGVATSALSAAAGDISSLATQFNGILTQIDNAANNSFYKGTNLLNSASHTLTVDLGDSSTLVVTGFDVTYSGLSVSQANNGAATGKADWSSSTDINASITQLDTAMSTLRVDSQGLSSNSNIVTIRQAFANNMISTLSQGADNLTLADMNEEGANMLMLQTRQALGISALGLSAQAAQSVLKLF
jgi:flagellin-like hook-associated protein FlgL